MYKLMLNLSFSLVRARARASFLSAGGGGEKGKKKKKKHENIATQIRRLHSKPSPILRLRFPFEKCCDLFGSILPWCAFPISQNMFCFVSV